MADSKTPGKPKPASLGWEIRVPTPGFRGERAGVKFAESVGRTSDPAAAAACRALGYQVTELKKG